MLWRKANYTHPAISPEQGPGYIEGLLQLEIRSETAVKNLGAWFDSTLWMSTHISRVCSAAFYHLHNISRIRKFLSLEDTKTLVHALVTSRVDYCNSLLYGIPASHLNKVQRVLNAAARLVCRAPRYCCITPLMRELHCLPIRQRIHFKILLFTLKAIHGIVVILTLASCCLVPKSRNSVLSSFNSSLTLIIQFLKSTIQLRIACTALSAAGVSSA